MAVVAVLFVPACSGNDGADVTAAASDSTTSVSSPDAGDSADSSTPTSDTTGNSPDPDQQTTSANETEASTGDVDDDGFTPSPVEWVESTRDVDTAVVRVPVDYDDPGGPTFDLFVARRRASDSGQRIGALFVNPGGPGREGSSLAFGAEDRWDSAITDRFDIIAWDPRGTGASTPAIDCVDDYDPYFTEPDSTPDSDDELEAVRGLAEQFADLCEERNGDILEFVGTNNSARDIDTIRRAIDEQTISYFGISYGSELGATWATMYPETVRAVVFDGASDPTADSFDSSALQLEGFETALSTFLERCSDDSGCEFHNDGDAEGAFDELMAALDDEPIAGAAGRPPVNRDVALNGVTRAMYSDSSWDGLARALAEAQFGDGSGLLAFHDAYYLRSADGSYSNFLEAFPVIYCADREERLSPDESDAESAALSKIASRFAPTGTVNYFCNYLPPARDPRIAITGAGAGPIVVIGTTGDPTTPLKATRAMADTLEDGRLVVVDANRHGGYGVNRCIVDLVNDYLVDLDPPPATSECT